MIDLTEKLVWVLTGLVIGFVLFAIFYKPTPQYSEDYLRQAFREANKPGASDSAVAPAPMDLPDYVKSGKGQVFGPGNGKGRKAKHKIVRRPGRSSRAGGRNRSGRFRGTRSQPDWNREAGSSGVTNPPTVIVPRAFVEKYKSKQEVVNLLNTASGQFTDVNGESAYELTWIDDGSLLADVVGLKAGDKVIDVNGHKVEKSPSAAWGLYDTLKNEKHFVVTVERRGVRVRLSYNVR
jgi:hypothetical protein